MKSILLATALLLNTTAAFALTSGGVDGGGGKGIVCRDSAGVITKAEVLDLYEGRVMYGLNTPTSAEPMLTQIERIREQLPVSQQFYINYYLKTVTENMRIMPLGTELLPIDDSAEVIAPTGCKTEQLANYYNDRKILVNGDIWAKLDETNRAALILHEAIFASNRTFAGAKNSRSSRHLVATLFDGTTKLVDVRDQLPAERLNCASMGNGVFFHAYRNQQSEWVLQFMTLGHNQIPTKTTATLSHPDFDFNEAKTFPVLTGDDNVGESVNTYAYTESAFEDRDIVSIVRKMEGVKNSDGEIIKGFQTPRYYMHWVSGTHPNTTGDSMLLNCSIEIPNNQKR